MISRKRKYNYIIICSFLIAIWLPTIDNITSFSANFNFDLNENRNLTKFPTIRNKKGKVKGSLIKKFPKNFDQYYSDNFGLREPILFFAKSSGLQKSSMNKRYVLGLNNWLFLTQENSLKNSLGSNLLSKKELKNVYNTLMKNWNLCKRKNIDYLFVIAPSKYSIYPEYLPKFISDIYKRKKNVKTNTDQILEFLKKKAPNFPILDLRKALIDVKKKNEDNFIYYKADTHWNGSGIEEGYKELKKVLKNDFQINLSNVSYDIFKKEANSGDLSSMSGIKHSYYTSLIKVKDFSVLIKKDKMNKYKIESFINNKSKNKKSAFIQHDSFFDHDMKSLIKNSFRKSSFAHKYSTCSILDKDIENSSIVIHEMVERTFINCRKT